MGTLGGFGGVVPDPLREGLPVGPFSLTGFNGNGGAKGPWGVEHAEVGWERRGERQAAWTPGVQLLLEIAFLTSGTKTVQFHYHVYPRGKYQNTLT